MILRNTLLVTSTNSIKHFFSLCVCVWWKYILLIFQVTFSMLLVYEFELLKSEILSNLKFLQNNSDKTKQYYHKFLLSNLCSNKNKASMSQFKYFKDVIQKFLFTKQHVQRVTLYLLYHHHLIILILHSPFKLEGKTSSLQSVHSGSLYLLMYVLLSSHLHSERLRQQSTINLLPFMDLSSFFWFYLDGIRVMDNEVFVS